jgi:hypothetical protein
MLNLISGMDSGLIVNLNSKFIKNGCKILCGCQATDK